jgi:amidase
MHGTHFTVEEATIDGIQQAFIARQLTVRGLCEIYLERIDKLDRNGPSLNSIITINPMLLQQADALDQHFSATGKLIGPLHGIPIVIKDQVETQGIMTTFGSAAQNGYIPDEDAHAVGRLRKAGGLILAKTTLPDWATSWFGNCSQQGETKNPYSLDHECGGSSAGTASAVAANLCTVGLGEDTGGSIRLPASFCNLVGFRVTPGLISRHGMSPLVVSQDTAGPMTRTVRDTALLLDALVAFDPADGFTIAAAIGGQAGHYAEALDPQNGLSGARIGLLVNRFDSEDTTSVDQVSALIAQATDSMRCAGAEIVEIEIPDLMDWIINTSVYLDESRANIDAFLSSRATMPTSSLAEIAASGQYEATLDLLVAIFEGPRHPQQQLEYHTKLRAREAFQRLVVSHLAEQRLDALAFAAVRILPPSRADVHAGRYDCLSFPTNTLIASQALMPSICLPVGFSADGLPVGMELITYPYHETKLLRLGSAFERVAPHRRSPAL